MSIIYRTEKGAPLAAEEIDGNFRELESRLKILEEHPESGEGIGNIQIHGDQMILTGTFGTDFGTFTLPKATFQPRGKWLSQTFYQELDIVTNNNVLYCCLKNHSSSQWEQDGHLWQEILALPPPPSSSLPIYEKTTLPKEATLGKLAIFMGEENPNLIFFNGKTWQYILKEEIQ